MVKSMAMSDPQRAKLVEATEIASAIASCEKDDNTKRMIVMSGLARVMEGFPVSPGCFKPLFPHTRTDLDTRRTRPSSSTTTATTTTPLTPKTSLPNSSTPPSPSPRTPPTAAAYHPRRPTPPCKVCCHQTPTPQRRPFTAASSSSRIDFSSPNVPPLTSRAGS